jgi:hypothetical protein
MIRNDLAMRAVVTDELACIAIRCGNSVGDTCLGYDSFYDHFVRFVYECLRYQQNKCSGVPVALIYLLCADDITDLRISN